MKWAPHTLVLVVGVHFSFRIAASHFSFLALWPKGNRNNLTFWSPTRYVQLKTQQLFTMAIFPLLHYNKHTFLSHQGGVALKNYSAQLIIIPQTFFHASSTKRSIYNYSVSYSTMLSPETKIQTCENLRFSDNSYL